MADHHRLSENMLDLLQKLERDLQVRLMTHFKESLQLSLKEDTCTHCAMASTAITISSVLTSAILTAEQGNKEEALKLFDTLADNIRQSLSTYSLKNAKVSVVASTPTSSEIIEVSDGKSAVQAVDDANNFISKIVANAKGNNRMN